MDSTNGSQNEINVTEGPSNAAKQKPSSRKLRDRLKGIISKQNRRQDMNKTVPYGSPTKSPLPNSKKCARGRTSLRPTSDIQANRTCSLWIAYN